MPTKKNRVGFIPRSDVLVLINKLCYESNLSKSKIINILVEEALYKRGMFNKETGKVIDENNNLDETRGGIENFKREFIFDFKNKSLKNVNHNNIEAEEVTLDNEIYAKFLMFLQFQEKMRKGNK